MSHANDIRRLRGISNRDMRRIIAAAIKSDLRYRMTKSGIMFYGENGATAGAHFTSSDHRAYRNLLADLRSVGYDPPEK
jgi:hypothetical protein